jgi:hypothetical protein
MHRVSICLILAVFFAISTHDGASAGASCYGTIVHADGAMTTIYRPRGHKKRVFVAHFDKKGNFTGSCERVSLGEEQARKAYMSAKSKWRAGYKPQVFPCLGIK